MAFREDVVPPPRGEERHEALDWSPWEDKPSNSMVTSFNSSAYFLHKAHFAKRSRSAGRRFASQLLLNKELVVFVSVSLLFLTWLLWMLARCYRAEHVLITSEQQESLLFVPPIPYASALTSDSESPYSKKLLDLHLMVRQTGECACAKDVASVIDTIVVPTKLIGLGEAGEEIDLHNAFIVPNFDSRSQMIEHWHPLCVRGDSSIDKPLNIASTVNAVSIFHSSIIVTYLQNNKWTTLGIQHKATAFCVQHMRWKLDGKLPAHSTCLDNI